LIDIHQSDIEASLCGEDAGDVMRARSPTQWSTLKTKLFLQGHWRE